MRLRDKAGSGVADETKEVKESNKQQSRIEKESMKRKSDAQSVYWSPNSIDVSMVRSSSKLGCCRVKGCVAQKT